MSKRTRIEPVPEPEPRVNESLAQDLRDLIHEASQRIWRRRRDEQRARDVDPDEAQS